MTIRKLWLLVLVLVSVISIATNTLILSILTDRYFTDYLTESYDLHVNQILDYSKSALMDENTSYSQMALELETHLNDPIIRIKLYNSEGELLVSVEDDYHISDNGMMGMMSFMMDDTSDEVHQYTLEEGNQVIGVLNITSHSLAENSFVARSFKNSLLLNSTYAVMIAVLITLIIGIVVSKRISQSLRDTAVMAKAIQVGDFERSKYSGVTEIKAIRQSLEELNARLKLKQKSRKALVDELVHQTRTPLTILKSHLEAIEDGLVAPTSKELQTCQNQIENITAIISNVSGLIDASREVDELTIVPVEFDQLIKQIVTGLKAQFIKKEIKIDLVSDTPIRLVTDQHKLSQAIYNLITNAYKYTNKGGIVLVSYIVLEDKIRIKIQDTGIGIAASDLDKVFNAYYRSDNAVHTDGDGIGLYIVQENLKMIHGTIHVQSQPNVGSTFTVELPLDLTKE